MKKIETKIITFNEQELPIKMDIEVVLNRKCSLPANLCEILKEKLNTNVDFNIISKQIDEVLEMDASLGDDFIDKVLPLIKEEIKNQTQEQITNEELLRVISLTKENKLKEAKKIFKDINFNNLSDIEKEEYKYYQFVFGNKDELFEEMKEYFKNNAQKLVKIYFDYIKYLEDKRDEKKPYKLIKEFEENFSIKLLDKNELSYFYYIKGRNYYYRGEYLLALENLKQAKVNVQNKRLLASIYNTTSNCFTDNLFFDEALQIANNALKIRKKFNFAEVRDTFSLIGGIYFKKGDFDNALKFYKKALKLKEDERIYNYLAKTSILKGDLKEAKNYLNKSKKDEKGFYLWIKTLYLYNLKEYEKIEKLYIKEFYCPEKRDKKDKFVIGWFFYVMSLIAIENQKFKKAKKYFSTSLEYFIKDNYILEAHFVKEDIFKRKKFKKVSAIFEIDKLFDEYMLKHKSISEDYKNYFDYTPKENVEFEKITLF